MGNENDTDTALFEVTHKTEQLLDLRFIEGRGRLIEDEHAALHIDRTSDSDHLLYSDRAACELLIGLDRDSERIEELARLFIHFTPVYGRTLAASDEDILSDREVRTERYFLINRADA